MAQRIQTLLIDDLMGGEADETVTFSLDGTSYEIDLNAENAKTLRGILTPYVEAGRRTRSSGRLRGTRAIPSITEDSAAIRRWAKNNGYAVNDRGRVPTPIRAAYKNALAS